MNPHINAISNRLSLRPPQRISLEILARICDIVPLEKSGELAAMLTAVQSEYPTVLDFEREFPSLCFALATGVGKTRLMGAFIAYLYKGEGIRNFFILAPNLTIYNKLISDFTPNSPKYVFQGIADFAVNPPEIITGDNYESGRGIRDESRRQKRLGFEFDSGVHVNIFNISKITSTETSQGAAKTNIPRIRRLQEYIGESYFEYLSKLDDLVLLMDESHRYRASAGMKAIGELKPILGLELTATPHVERGGGTVPFQNVVYSYPLSEAMADGFVKEPAVATRANFDAKNYDAAGLERLKLEDGVRIHEDTKIQLETYARNNDRPIVKPFMLIIARDTQHADALVQFIEDESFFRGDYRGKVITVHSKLKGDEADETVEQLINVEKPENPTEIVVHVNMLKEGWDVTNLYTIVPLRAANARILIEQSIGRGLRLPYGRRAGVTAVDRLNIVAHDKFQEIIDEANKPDSAIRLQAVVLNPDELGQRTVTVVSQSQLASKLGLQPEQVTSSTAVAGKGEAPLFAKPEEQRVAQIAYEVIRKLENQPEKLPTVGYLQRPEVREAIAQEVAVQYRPAQLAMDAVVEPPDIAEVVAKTTEFVAQQTIGIPRILVVPTGAVKSGFKPFQLRVETLRYPAVSEELWVQYLRTGGTETVALGRGGIEEERLEDYIVSGLVDFDDISYDDHADLLYDLASQTVRHFKSYLSEDEVRKVLRCYQRDIARFIHAQMQEHYWEEAVGHEVKISKGFTELKPSAYSAGAGEAPLDFRLSPDEKSNMAKYLFGGLRRCLYPVQKFQSDPERKLAVILDRETLKWFRPAKGQFQIYYRNGADHLEYQPDFVAETADAIYMLESKRRTDLGTEEVEAKKAAAVQWCQHASAHAASYDGKPWRYVLVPHDVIAENMTLEVLAGQFGVV